MSLESNQISSDQLFTSTLYVGNLAKDVTKEILVELFSAIGPISSIRVCQNGGATPQSLGYAFINFLSIQDAKRALNELNFIVINGEQCRIAWYQRDKELRKCGNKNIFVKNLEESIDNKALYDMFSRFGNILNYKLVIDPKKQKSRGYGYVYYEKEESAQTAIKQLNGTTVKDHVIEVQLFKPKEERKVILNFTNVYVKYIPRHWSDDILKEIFEQHTGGKIEKYEIWRHDFGVSACLQFESSEHAMLAVEQLNDRDVNSFNISSSNHDNNNKDDEKKETSPTKLYVAKAQKRRKRKDYLLRQKKKRKENNLYIKNLNAMIDDSKLHAMFEQFGKIRSVKVMRESNGKSRGFGFVAFETQNAARKAMEEMHGIQHFGKLLYVSYAQKKEDRKKEIMGRLQNRRTNENVINYDEGQILPFNLMNIGEQMQINPYYMNNYIYPQFAMYHDQQPIGNWCNQPAILMNGYNVNVMEGLNINNDAINALEEEENEVSIWLRDVLKLPEYINLFKENGVEDMETVQLLTEDDITKEMGIVKIGHKRKIMANIEKMNAMNSTHK